MEPAARATTTISGALKQFQNEIKRSILDELLRKKCAVRDVSFKTLDYFFTQELVTEAQKHWEATLTTFVPDLAPCDQVLGELKELLPSFFKFGP